MDSRIRGNDNWNSLILIATIFDDVFLGYKKKKPEVIRLLFLNLFNE